MQRGKASRTWQAVAGGKPVDRPSRASGRKGDDDWEGRRLKVKRLRLWWWLTGLCGRCGGRRISSGYYSGAPTCHRWIWCKPLQCKQQNNRPARTHSL